MDDDDTEPFIECGPELRYVLNKPVASYIRRVTGDYERTPLLPFDLSQLTQDQAFEIIKKFCDGTVTATCALRPTQFPVGLRQEFTSLSKLDQILLWDEFWDRFHEESPALCQFVAAIKARALSSEDSHPKIAEILKAAPTILQYYAQSQGDILSFENAAARDLHLAILDTLKPTMSRSPLSDKNLRELN